MAFARFYFVIPLWLLLCALTAAEKKQAFTALSSSNEETLKSLIKKCEKTGTSEDNAYRGAMMMRSADFEFWPSDKLKMFVRGEKLLEAEIKAKKDNVEYRFLRLMTQENAPKFLGYNSNIQEDAKLIAANYSKQIDEVKTAISGYRKQSPALKKLTLK